MFHILSMLWSHFICFGSLGFQQEADAFYGPGRKPSYGVVHLRFAWLETARYTRWVHSSSIDTHCIRTIPMGCHEFQGFDMFCISHLRFVFGVAYVNKWPSFAATNFAGCEQPGQSLPARSFGQLRLKFEQLEGPKQLETSTTKRYETPPKAQQRGHWNMWLPNTNTAAVQILILGLFGTCWSMWNDVAKALAIPSSTLTQHAWKRPDRWCRCVLGLREALPWIWKALKNQYKPCMTFTAQTRQMRAKLTASFKGCPMVVADGLQVNRTKGFGRSAQVCTGHRLQFRLWVRRSQVLGYQKNNAMDDHRNCEAWPKHSYPSSTCSRDFCLELLFGQAVRHVLFSIQRASTSLVYS